MILFLNNCAPVGLIACARMPDGLLLVFVNGCCLMILVLNNCAPGGLTAYTCLLNDLRPCGQ